MSKIKILHLAEYLRVGGLEKVIYDLSTRANRDEFEINVCCISGGGEFADRLIKEGISVETLGIQSYYNPFDVLKFINYLRANRPHIIHSHTFFSNTLSRIASGFLRNTVKKAV